MMDDAYAELVRSKISKKLINADFDPACIGQNVVFSNKQIMLEQYKLLVDSAHKGEERRAASNNIFLSINSLIASFFIRPTQILNMQEKDIPISIFIGLIGMFISWEWLKVNASYKKLNFINYALINSLEKLFPANVFSLRAQIEIEPQEEKPTNVGSIILTKENLLPKAFFLLYLIYFLTVCASLLPFIKRLL
jgi:hypothetical protein